MKKIVIPAILGAVVLMAGFVALMPVQRAQTIHTFLAGQLSGLDAELNAIATVLCQQVNEDFDFAFDPDTGECFDTEAEG
jgi:hypothetical protein